MNTPTTYSEWITCFDVAKEGMRDQEVLDCVKRGSLVLSAGVAGRFATQLNDVVQHRMKRASDKFSRAMQTSNGDMNLLINALLGLRKEFKFLIQFVHIPVLSTDDIEMLVTAIREQADAIQESLEMTSKRNDRSGMMASIIRRNRVNHLEDI